MIANRRLMIGASVALMLGTLLLPVVHRRPGRSPSKAIGQIPAAPRAKPNINTSLQNLPLSFEPNEGQARSAVQYLARGANFTLFLKSSEATLALPRRPVASKAFRKLANRASFLALQLKGANRAAEMKALDPLIGKVNYLGKEYPHAGLTNIPTFAKIEYKDIYPGIDLAYHGTQRQLEYDFIVAPGADPPRHCNALFRRKVPSP